MHLRLQMRTLGDDLVYSANFYADRSREHATGFYTDELMVRVPKKEYLYGTTSSLGDTASFGLDFGEIYKRSVIGVRVYGVPLSERKARSPTSSRESTMTTGRVPATPNTTMAKSATTTCD